MAVTLSKTTCAFCKGMGVDQTGVTSRDSKCPVCNGRKAVYVQEPFVPCLECEGKGRKPGTQMSCLKCRGKGVVHQPQQQPDEYAEWGGQTAKYSQWNGGGEGAWKS